MLAQKDREVEDYFLVIRMAGGVRTRGGIRMNGLEKSRSMPIRAGPNEIRGVWSAGRFCGHFRTTEENTNDRSPAGLGGLHGLRMITPLSFAMWLGRATRAICGLPQAII